MKTMIRFVMCGMITVMLLYSSAFSQKLDDERMNRDIEVAESALTTLIKQQFNNQRVIFPLEVRGSYQAGYGVTFTLPTASTINFIGGSGSGPDVVVYGTDQSSFTYRYDSDNEEPAVKAASERYALKEKREKRSANMDSIRDASNLKVVEAAKTFIVDYGDIITQLGPNEKIIVTNRGSMNRLWAGAYMGNAPKRTRLSIEGTKGDVTQFKQGKLTRDQLLAKIKVVNTETVDAAEPDLELLSSIFNRLYREDLSKNYFVQENIYYERLKDFGVIYNMRVYSSQDNGFRGWRMPTLGLDDVDQQTRDKKVVELYPKFEQEMKENILEYGRTLKTLKDDEVLVFQVTLTTCKGCGIPSTLEYTVKGSVLKDFNAGKAEKNPSLAKINVKKGPNQ